MTDTYPPLLQTILAEIAARDFRRGDLESVRVRWNEYLARVGETIPGVEIESGGESVHLGRLSPGCQACKDGTWDCVFITMRCNLECPFCYSPEARLADFSGSVFGKTPEEIAEKYVQSGIRGVGLSGGEPFLRMEELINWLKRLRQLYPQAYYWVYTNGLLVDEATLSRLGELGLDEIRFNLAATGYNNPTVMQNVAAAVRRLPRVTVEIPSIPEHAHKILACLARWADLGVRTLNLHELIYEPGTRSQSMAGERLEFIAPDGHVAMFNPESRELTLAVLARVAEQGLPLAVNDCSMQSKMRQLRGRRRNIYRVLRPETEKLVDDREYETICAFTAQDGLFIHPDDYPQAHSHLPGYRFARLRRLAPLALQAQPQWISCEILI